MALYGSQVAPMPGQANVGYGPGGQHFNEANPVAMTTSGVRPLSVASVQVQPHNAAPGTVSRETQMQQANYRPPAWTAQGKALAAREQQVYGGDLYGNQAATAGLGATQGGTGAGGPLGQSPIGIGGNQNGVLSGAQARLHYGQAPGVPVSGAAQNEINRQFGDVYGAQQNTADLDLLRRTAFEGSNLNLDRLKAQSSANVDWQNLMARLLESQMQRENVGIGTLYGLT